MPVSNEEKIVKPIYKQEPKKQEVKSSKPQGENKEPEPDIKVVEERQDVHFRNDDGSPVKEWQWDTSAPLHLQPLWTTTRDVLGLSAKEAGMDENVVANIASYAATITQSENSKIIFKFLKDKLMQMPPNVGNPLYYLQRLLLFELEELKNLERR